MLRRRAMRAVGEKASTGSAPDFDDYAVENFTSRCPAAAAGPP
jgi:hypothetical protein